MPRQKRADAPGRGTTEVEGNGASPYEKIRDAILDGTFAAGSQLVEITIADLCGVSRTPVREALTRLEQDGLVERGPRGLVVRKRSPEEILDIYEARIVLEGLAARIAAERRTELDLARIEGAYQSGEGADVGNPASLVTLNNQFHRAIWRASRNESLIDLLQRLSMHLSRYPETTLSYPGRWAESQRQHREIADAIAARDGTKAAALAEAHFQRAREIRLELWGHNID